jgi:hypothetical protein
MPSPPAGLRPFLILTGHFFRRFFLNEETGFEEEVKLKMVAAGALVAALVGSAANGILFKYMFIPDAGQSWLEKGYILTLLMVLTAFLVVLEWDVLFPGRQDFQNLSPLPIGPRTLFGAKLASFLILVALFTLIANALAVFAFAIYLPQWQPHSWMFSIRLFFVHLLSSLAADVFMFLALACLIGVLMVVLSPGLFRLVSLALRFLLLIFFVVFGLSLVSDSLGDPRLFESLNGVVQGRSALVYYVPSLWYTGLYERLLGNPDPAFASLAALGVFALAAALGMFYLVFAAGYRRQASRSQEVGVHRPPFPALRSGWARAFSSVVLRHPVERAVFIFFGRTLARSPRHKWRAAAIMSVPVGLALLLGSWGGVRPGAEPAGALLGIPVTAALFLLVGARALAASPSAPEANWIFRLTEHPDRRPYFVGVKKAVFWLGLVPLFLAVLALSWPLWGWRSALLHALFGLSISALLEQVIFFRFAKIPFACASLPGRERLQFLWFVYLGGFLIFISLMTRLEAALFRSPGDFKGFLAIMAVLLLASGVANRLYFYPRTDLVYEERPEPAFISLRTRP